MFEIPNLFYLLMHIQCLAQCLVHKNPSINISLIFKEVSIVPIKHLIKTVSMVVMMMMVMSKKVGEGKKVNHLRFYHDVGHNGVSNSHEITL